MKKFKSIITSFFLHMRLNLVPYVDINRPLSSASVRPFQRLYGPHWQPRAKHGTARQRRARRDPWSVHLLHEESRDQTQPGTAPLHAAWTHTPPHTDLKPSFLAVTEDWQEAACSSCSDCSRNSSSCFFDVFLVQTGVDAAGKWVLNLVPYPPSDCQSSISFLFSVIYLFGGFLLKRACKRLVDVQDSLVKSF